MMNVFKTVRVVVAVLCVGLLSAVASPQDRWYVESVWETFDSAATNAMLGWVERMDVHPANDRVYVMTDHAGLEVAAYSYGPVA